MPIAHSIANTATDALNAKLSAISVGYKFTHSNASIYSSTLYLIASQLAQIDENQKNKWKHSTLNSKTPKQNEQCSYKDETDSKLSSHQRSQKTKNKDTHHVEHKSKKVVRRQCPLVNAGYAARVSIITCAVQHFITYHKSIYICKQTNPQYHNTFPYIKYDEINDAVDTDSHVDKMKEQSMNARGINLILLGGGMDTLGVWATSLTEGMIENEDESSELDSFHIDVYDLDCAENARLKRNIMYEIGLYTPDLSYENDSNKTTKNKEKYGNEINLKFFEEGRIDMTCISENNYNAPSLCDVKDLEEENKIRKAQPNMKNKYSFIGVDLKDISSVEYALNEMAYFDWKKPTLVLSELVLSYLGTDATDKILRFFFSNLNNTANSAFIAYEPIGSIMQDTSSITVHPSSSSINAYTAEYNARFADKLNRGRHPSKKDNDNIPEVTAFEPLGPSCSLINDRFKTCAKDTSFHRNTISLPAFKAVSVSECNECLKKCPEVFDEHAAFVLHLCSYTFTIALSCSSFKFKHKGDTSYILPMKWLPSTSMHYDENISTKHTSYEKTTSFDNQPYLPCNWDIEDVEIVPIETRLDDEQVRSLFQNIYIPYSDQYPAVRKMMKTALKTDLKGTNSNNTSSIGSFYRECGGEFWIGIMRNKKDNGHMRNRKVIACLGIRDQLSSPNLSHESHTITFPTFEINRLLVDPSYRCRGIGRLLLDVASQYCEKLKHVRAIGDDNFIQIRASTPDILTAANKLYESCGYSLIENRQINKMRICTHVKKV